MAYIRTTDRDEATGELASAYDTVRGARSSVANILSADAFVNRMGLGLGVELEEGFPPR